MAVSETGGAQFDFGRVTSRTFGLVGRNFVPFAILSFIFAGLPAAITMLVQPALLKQATATSPQDPTMLLIVVYSALIISWLANLILSAALTRASIDDLSGAPVSIGAALSTGLALFFPMLGLGIVAGLGVGLGFLLLIVPGIYLLLRWLVAPQVLVVERPGIFKAMERSSHLTQNHRWAILGLIILYGIIVFVIQMTIFLLIPGGMAAMSGLSGEGPPILAVLLLTAVGVVTSMIGTVGMASIYFELRQLKEGVDVSELAKVFS